jgi:hypothetical protein
LLVAFCDFRPVFFVVMTASLGFSDTDLF